MCIGSGTKQIEFPFNDSLCKLGRRLPVFGLFNDATLKTNVHWVLRVVCVRIHVNATECRGQNCVLSQFAGLSRELSEILLYSAGC